MGGGGVDEEEEVEGLEILRPSGNIRRGKRGGKCNKTTDKKNQGKCDTKPETGEKNEKR